MTTDPECWTAEMQADYMARYVAGEPVTEAERQAAYRFALTPPPNRFVSSSEWMNERILTLQDEREKLRMTINELSAELGETRAQLARQLETTAMLSGYAQIARDERDATQNALERERETVAGLLRLVPAKHFQDDSVEAALKGDAHYPPFTATDLPKYVCGTCQFPFPVQDEIAMFPTCPACGASSTSGKVLDRTP